MCTDKKLKWTADVLIPLFFALVTFAMILWEPFYAIDAMFCDRVFSKMYGTGNDIVIIAADEETLAEYGEFSRWSRNKSAEIARFLFDDEKNSPAVLSFDIMFVGNRDNDGELVEAFRGKNIVTASNLVYRGEVVDRDGKLYYNARNIADEERPFPELDNVVSSGFSNAQYSPDGLVRSAQLMAEYDGETRYSFAAQVYRQYCGAVGKEPAMPKMNVYNEVLFDYAGKPSEFEHFSLCDVLGGKIDRSFFNGKIVMVGAYAPGLRDSFRTPADRGRDMYGVEVNANIIRALMTGNTAQKGSRTIHGIAAALLVFLYVFTARKMKMYPAVLSVIWVFIIDIAAGLILSRCGIRITLIYPLLASAAAALVIFFEKYIGELLRKRNILLNFGKYLSPQVIEKLAKNEDYTFTLGVERREICVLFVDIRGFTAMSEVIAPEEVAAILNDYLSQVTECVFRHSGMLDKFIGDAAMAVFNAPADLDDYLYRAVCAAVDIRDSGSELGKRLAEKYGRTVGFGIGLHWGEAVVGNIGCDTRMDYTAIGDTVNTASRLESKAAAGEILISHELYDRLKERINAEFKGEMTLKGKAAPVKVYSVTGVK